MHLEIYPNWGSRGDYQHTFFLWKEDLSQSTSQAGSGEQGTQRGHSFMWEHLLNVREVPCSSPNAKQKPFWALLMTLLVDWAASLYSYYGSAHRVIFKYSILGIHWVWRDGSAVKNIHCSCTGHEFSSHIRQLTTAGNCSSRSEAPWPPHTQTYTCARK